MADIPVHRDEHKAATDPPGLDRALAEAARLGELVSQGLIGELAEAAARHRTQIRLEIIPAGYYEEEDTDR